MQPFLLAVRRQNQPMRIALLACVFALLAVFSGARAAERAAPPSQFTLQNGLTIVVVPDHRVPVVTHRVVYRIGSVDEAPSEEGLAHYLEHLMFLGTQKYPHGALRQLVKTWGGSENAGTSTDLTTYYQRMPREALEKLMDIEADRMERLVASEAASQNERSVVMEEYRGRSGDTAYPLHLAMANALFGNHPYARPVGGTEEQIATLNLAKAMAFYRRHYSPDRAIVIIGGDVTEQEVRKLAERTYAQVAVKPGTAPADHSLPQLGVTAKRLVVPADVSAVTVWRSYLLDKSVDLQIADTLALSLFLDIATKGMTSRLHRDLVVPGLATGTFPYMSLQRYAGQIGLGVTGRPGVAGEAVEAAFDQALARLATDGVTEDEFSHAKRSALAARAWDEDNTVERCQEIGDLMIAGWQLSDVLDAETRVAALTRDDVNRVARDVLQKRRSVTGLLVPKTAAALEHQGISRP